MPSRCSPHRFLRRITLRESTDEQLLDRFANRADQEAFAALVSRHGPLVLGVCRRVLGDAHAAEDAFQTTFLVLARKAGKLNRSTALAPWLYGVAYRTAAKARTAAQRRLNHERRAAIPAAWQAGDGPDWRDLRPILDAAVSRLPACYREAFVLCQVQGRTHAEAARLLGCQRGTIAARVARACTRLRDQLARRGVTPAAGAFALTLAPAVWSAPVPTRLVQTAASAATASPAAFTAKLLGGMMMTLTVSRMKIAAVLVTCGLLGAGAVGLSDPPRPEQTRETAEDHTPARQVPASDPFPEQPPERVKQLADYLNNNARNVRNVIFSAVSLEAETKGQAGSVQGWLAYRQPRDFRVVGKAFGADELDAGSNDRECWLWVKRSAPRPKVLHFPHDRPRPVWLQPEWLTEVLGVAGVQLDARSEVVARGDKLVELVRWSHQAGVGQIRQVTVFAVYRQSPPHPQVVEHRLEDSQGRVICSAKIEETWKDLKSGAILPRKLVLGWPQEQTRIKVELREPKLNEELPPTRAAVLFAPPEAWK